MNGNNPVTRRTFPFAPPPAGVLLLVIALFAPRASAAADRKAPAADPAATVPEFSVSGRYAETCTDRPLCGAWFGSPPTPGPCRKVMLFQFIRSRYGTVDIHNLTAIVAVESGEGTPVAFRPGTPWPFCELTLPESADSMQAAALRSVMGLLLWGEPGGHFTSVRTLPLAVGLNESRIIAESPDRLKIRIHPLLTHGRTGSPEVTNITGPLPCLGGPYVYRADTLFYAIGNESPEGGSAAGWNARECSGALTVFSWNRDVWRSAMLKPE